VTREPTDLVAFVEWRDRYLATGTVEPPISYARCTTKGCGESAGHTWRHDEYGVLFEGVTRTSETVEIERVLGPVPPGFGGWQNERWLIPLEWGATVGRVIPVTCTRGHKWALDLGDALRATRGRSQIRVRPR
jgi:hypothetical protein